MGMSDQSDPTAWRPGPAQMERSACPLCAGTQFELLADTDRYDMGLVTVGCVGCGLVMTNPQPTAAALDEFYGRHYRQYYEGVDAPTEAYIQAKGKDRRSTATVSFLKSQGLVAPGSTVLDIGASEGCLLKAVADAEPTTRRLAVEPNASFAPFAATHAGCAVYPSLEALAASGSGAVDLITLTHVFEHVKQPVAFLASLGELLAADGRVYIDVPDVTRYRKLSSLHIAHLYHFGPDTLRRTAACAGFAVELLEPHDPIKHPVSLRCILRRAQMEAAPLANLEEGWEAVRQANRQAWRAHPGRWSLGRRLARLFG